MKRIMLKIVLTIVVIFCGGFILTIIKILDSVSSGSSMANSNIGILPLMIIYLGMFAAIRAIWKYNPEKSKNTDITLKKDND